MHYCNRPLLNAVAEATAAPPAVAEASFGSLGPLERAERTHSVCCATPGVDAPRSGSGFGSAGFPRVLTGRDPRVAGQRRRPTRGSRVGRMARPDLNFRDGNGTWPVLFAVLPRQALKGI